MRRSGGRTAALGLVLLALAPVARAAAADELGPPLSVPRARLAAALHCPAAFRSGREPILLVHGTAATGSLNWSWNYGRELPQLGYDTCFVDLPEHAYGDIQPASEYVVYAVRTMAARSGRRVDVIGHSQGALEPRWALKWWPDLQERIDDYISLSGPHRGTQLSDFGCSKGSCPAAIWQMKPGSHFLTTLNAGGETPGPISYTSIFTANDELVRPYTNSPLDGASNILVQSLCPGRRVTHFGMVYDAEVFALAMDAITHPGPADPRRFDHATCATRVMPGADTTTANLFELLSDPGAIFLTEVAPQIGREPPLAAYALRPPAMRAPARIRLRVRPATAIAGRRTRFRFVATANGRRLTGATIRFAGRRARTNRRGRADIVARLRAGSRVARATRRGLRPGSARVHVRRPRS